MPQIKKTMIKTRIDEAALKVFSRKGYKAASIKDISIESDVSVGNIYKYYANKKAIYQEIAGDGFIDQFKDVLYQKIVNGANDRIMAKFLGENKAQFLLLYNECDGTSYQGKALELAGYLCDLVIKQYQLKISEQTRNTMLQIYQNHNSMIKEIMLKYDSDKDIIAQISILNVYHKNGMLAFIKALVKTD